MRSLAPALAGFTGFALAAGGAAPAAAQLEPPIHYLGVGARGGFNDSTAAVIKAKLKINGEDAPGLSLRPALLLGDEIEVRLPLTVDIEVTERFYPFAGAGVAYNTDGFSAIDPMITGGSDFRLTENLILALEGNLIFQLDASDTDAEFIGTINYEF